jgi:hypothetical protein
VEVDIGNERAEFENLASSLVGALDAGVLATKNTRPSASRQSKTGGIIMGNTHFYTAVALQLHDGPLECSVGMDDVEAKSNALAEQELAGKNLVGRFLELSRKSKTFESLVSRQIRI